MNFEFIEKVWEGLIRRAESLPHALLIHGPRGTGKLALARRFSNFLLCESTPETRPCGRCGACRWLADGNHPDFRLIQPEALAEESGEPADASEGSENTGKKTKPSLEIKVAQIRALAEFLYVGSHRGARRIALVHPAEAMNPNTANALLKALEEPPAGAVFILVTHALARLLPTVRSRCVKIPVAIPDLESASKWLKGNGIQESSRWLRWSGGAPLLAQEIAQGERAAELQRLIDTLAAGQRPAGIQTRESLELLVEVLQKMAFDAAISGFSGQSRYGTWGNRSPSGSPERWLAFARGMGRQRAMARRPVNAMLFSEELLNRFPGL